MTEHLLPAIESFLQEPIIRIYTVGGGCIANNKKIATASGKEYFLKSGLPADLFRCESNGLAELAQSGTLRIPQIILIHDEFLLLEFIPSHPPGSHFYFQFGENLAEMHQQTSSWYGFYENNYIGSTPQINLAEEKEKTDWATFYFHKRLLFQYQLAEKRGYSTSRLTKGFARLESMIENILAGSEEPPSLLHGDLWSGNYMCDEEGNAVLIDPAVYYGHREAELAMTRLFGGFPPAFYEGYNQTYPLPEDWEYRENIYKLYHILNHLNLFGKSYLSEAEFLLEFYL